MLSVSVCEKRGVILKRSINMIKGDLGKEDFHVHPRPDCTNEQILSLYVNELKQRGVSKIGFVEHGIRKSNKHQSILYDEHTINDFVLTIANIRSIEESNIWSGIEVDYLGCDKYANDYINMVNDTNIGFIIGSVHGRYDDYNSYLEDTIAMLENYPIDILGHFKISDDIWMYKNVNRVVELLNEKQVLFEVNIAPRYDASFRAKEYMYDLIKEKNIGISVGSDVHSIDDIYKNYKNLSWMQVINKY